MEEYRYGVAIACRTFDEQERADRSVCRQLAQSLDKLRWRRISCTISGGTGRRDTVAIVVKKGARRGGETKRNNGGEKGEIKSVVVLQWIGKGERRS
jgi:hypothetical protein